MENTLQAVPQNWYLVLSTLLFCGVAVLKPGARSNSTDFFNV